MKVEPGKGERVSGFLLGPDRMRAGGEKMKVGLGRGRSVP